MKQFYRQATSQELDFYQQKLYPLQDKLFKIASLYREKIYLVGGTALARFHFGHRLSEDLDFFTITDDLQPIAIDLIARLRNQGFTLEIDKLELYFARFYVLKEDYALKVEFAREYHLIGDLIKTKEGIFCDNLDDLGTNKITAFEDRAEIKDIIDLYYITQQISLERLFELADIKRVPVSYENLLAINSLGISGRALLTPSEELPEAKIVRFMQELKEQTELEVKKKEALERARISRLVEKLLWDFPRHERQINRYSIPVLTRRLNKLPLPQRIALSASL